MPILPGRLMDGWRREDYMSSDGRLMPRGKKEKVGIFGLTLPYLGYVCRK